MLQIMKTSLIVIIFTFTLSACQSMFGPSALKNTHPAYNQAIAQTLNEQMLLNLVRLKYRDKAHFLKINSVTAALSLNTNIGLDVDFDLATAGNVVNPDLGISYADSPTISFQPLQGEDFLKSVMSSISLDALLVMTQSGWNFERVFGLCIERINSIHNAPRASGPTPANEPDYKKFKHLLSLIRELQLGGHLEFGSATTSDKNQLMVLIKITDKSADIVKEFTSLLDLHYSDKTSLPVKISTNFLKSNSNQITIRTRSIASIMFYLAQNTHLPQSHIDSGLVTVTKNRLGQTFNWSETPAGSVFEIRFSKEYPQQAYLAVPYRDHWFYIADNDLETKSTFMLLTQLFDMQEGQTTYSGPTLTLPVR